MIKLLPILEQALKETDLDEGPKDWLKKAGMATALAAIPLSQPPKDMPQKALQVAKGFDFSNDPAANVTVDVKKASRQYVLNFLKAAESSGGIQLNHKWLTKGPNKGERGIRSLCVYAINC